MTTSIDVYVAETETTHVSESLKRSIRHFSQSEVARRWQISSRTLERWRWLGQGPRYMKIGGRVVYRFVDLVAYEEQRLRDGCHTKPVDA